MAQVHPQALDGVLRLLATPSYIAPLQIHLKIFTIQSEIRGAWVVSLKTQECDAATEWLLEKTRACKQYVIPGTKIAKRFNFLRVARLYPLAILQQINYSADLTTVSEYNPATQICVIFELYRSDQKIGDDVHIYTFVFALDGKIPTNQQFSLAALNTQPALVNPPDPKRLFRQFPSAVLDALRAQDLSDFNPHDPVAAKEWFSLFTKCSACGKASRKLKKCARCHTVRYCNKTCQTRDFPKHTYDCTLFHNMGAHLAPFV